MKEQSLTIRCASKRVADQLHEELSGMVDTHINCIYYDEDWHLELEADEDTMDLLDDILYPNEGFWDGGYEYAIEDID